MGVFDLIPFLKGDQNREVFKSLGEYVNVVYSMVNELEKVIDALQTKDMKMLHEGQRKLSLLEADTDKLRRKIEAEVYSSGLYPMSRSIIHKFIEKTDEVVDSMEDVSRLTAFLENEEMPPEVLKLLNLQLKTVGDGIDLLRRSIEKVTRVEELQEIVDKIRAKEEESDNIRDQSFKVLYAADYKPKILILLAEMIKALHQILDRAEDAADTIALIVFVHKQP